MIYDRLPTHGDGIWHCPFSREWVMLMKQAAKRCEHLTEAHIEAAMNREAYYYRIPPGKFLSQPQDARGLPPMYWECFARWPSCDSTYDYDSIPDIVVTNGADDWPLTMYHEKLTA